MKNIRPIFFAFLVSHQNSLNLLIITKLNSEIIYFSPVQVGTHDQKQWNLLSLWSLFLGRLCILGDGGFTFNKEFDQVWTETYQKAKKGILHHIAKKIEHKAFGDASNCGELQTGRPATGEKFFKENEKWFRPLKIDIQKHRMQNVNKYVCFFFIDILFRIVNNDSSILLKF